MNARLISIAAAILMSGAALLAQNPQGRGFQGGRQGNGQQRPDPAQIAEMTANRIASELALDEATAQKFVSVYKEYKESMMAVMKDGKTPHKQGERPTLTEEEADAKIVADFSKSRRIVDVREEYYAKFREFMTAKQMLRVYSYERNDAGHMRSEFDRRQPGGPQGQPGMHHQGGFPQEARGGFAE